MRLEESPSSERAQALAARWRTMVDQTSGGDPGVKAGLMQAWADRRNWPATLRWRVEGLHMMPYERFVECADFIDGAVARAAMAGLETGPTGIRRNAFRSSNIKGREV